MNRREFLQVLAAAAAAGLPLASRDALAQGRGAAAIYDVAPFGNVSLLHFTDCHAQLLPVYFREPSVNLGVGAAAGKPPHLVGEHLLKHFGIAPGTRDAHAFTYLDFARAAQRLRPDGRLRASRHAGEAAEGHAPGRAAARRRRHLAGLGDVAVDARARTWSTRRSCWASTSMTGHWEFTYGAERVKEVVEKDFAGKIDFVAQNVRTADFGDPVFKPYVMRQINGVPVAIIGQAFPYTPIANPRYFVPEWTFGIQEEEMQKVVDEARAKGAQVVVLLSHNGMDVDLKLASRVTGIDAILGGHTHDGVPQPTLVANRGGKTLVTNAGSNGKFLAVLDLDVKSGKVADFRYRLLPVFSALLPPDHGDGRADPRRARAVLAAKLDEKLATTEGLLYRRGNFNGTSDQLILDALMAEKNAEIAFSPGLPLGHDAASRPGDPHGAPDGPDGDHLSVRDGQRIHRRDDQDDPRGRRRQPVQSRSVLPAGRRHGARRRPAVHDRPEGGDGRADHADGARAASRSMRRRSTRSPAGRRCPRRRGPPAASRSGTCVARYLRAQEDDRAAHAQLPVIEGMQGNPGMA